MKLLEKVKNMFTEEIDDEEPIKKEVIQVEIKAPEKKEEPKVRIETTPVEKAVTENETLKKDEKFKFPVYFDEKDFDKIETRAPQPPKAPQTRTTVRMEPPRREKKSKEAYGGKNPAMSAKTNINKEEKKVFKPTPIISPVYGILDKNYKKEDITPKKRITSENYRKPQAVTIDDVRNKAFGSLEDDLETAIFGKDSILFNNESEEEKTDLFDELEDKAPRHGRVEKNKTRTQSKEMDLLDEVNDLANIAIKERASEEELESRKTTRSEKKEEKSGNMIEEEMDKIYNTKPSEEELTESDLFNLIDSMYEKKEDE